MRDHCVILRRPDSPSFCIALQAGQDLHQQLHDDRGGDVRNHVQREQAEALQRATREHVEHVHDGALLRLHQLQHRLGIDARHRDEAAQAIDDQRPEHEQQALAQFGELADAAQLPAALPLRAMRCLLLASPAAWLTWPPAASIAALAPAVASRPLSTNFLLTSPFLTILACLALVGTSLAAAARRNRSCRRPACPAGTAALRRRRALAWNGNRSSAGDAASASGRLRSRP